MINETGHIIQEFSIGNTRIKIADNYCSGKTQEEVQAALRRIARNVQEHISTVALCKKEGTM